MDQSLVSQLLYLNLQRGATIWCNSPLTELIVGNGKVVGAVISHENRMPKRMRARRGVLLVAGGLARNKEMRQKY